MVTTLLNDAARAATARDSSGRNLPSLESQTRIMHGIKSHVICINKSGEDNNHATHIFGRLFGRRQILELKV